MPKQHFPYIILGYFGSPSFAASVFCLFLIPSSFSILRIFRLRFSSPLRSSGELPGAATKGKGDRRHGNLGPARGA